jgi:hypothetical protein
MIIPNIPEIQLIGVADPNIPNKERIVMKAQDNIDLGEYGLIVGFKNDQSVVLPLKDYFFWFGNVEVEAFSWIFVYTGYGQFQRTRLSGTQELAYTMHWGKQITVFTNVDLVPIIIKMSNILIGQPLKSVTEK